MIALRALPGVEFVSVNFSDFFVPWVKPTFLLRNTPKLHVLSRDKVPWSGTIIPLRGMTTWKGRKVFKTSLAQAYPPMLCVSMARLLQEGQGMRPGAVPDVNFAFPDALRAAQQVCELSTCELRFIVREGMGAPIGLTPLQHIDFARRVQHPAAKDRAMLKELKDAVKVECFTRAEDIDEFCERLLQQIRQKANELEPARRDWLAQAPVQLQPLLHNVHGPLWEFLLQECGVDGSDFLRCLQQGFPLVGDLPPCEGCSTECAFPLVGGATELKELRLQLNQQVVQAVKELPYSNDIMPQVWQDCELGAMSEPRLLDPNDLYSGSLTRRIPVRELRAKGWRARVVDHETESGINGATRPCDQISHETLDSLTAQVLWAFQHGMEVEMWKRGISQAFRRVPIFTEHLEFAWTVWAHNGQWTVVDRPAQRNALRHCLSSVCVA